MNNVVEQVGIAVPAQSPRPRGVFFFLAACTWILAILALLSGIVLLFSDLFLANVPWLAHAPISAAPLLLIGAASLGFQAWLRPALLDWCKALIVSLAFILWGVDQLLPGGWGATTLGDLVIVLYVIDLGWMMTDMLRSGRR